VRVLPERRKKKKERSQSAHVHLGLSSSFYGRGSRRKVDAGEASAKRGGGEKKGGSELTAEPTAPFWLHSATMSAQDKRFGKKMTGEGKKGKEESAYGSLCFLNHVARFLWGTRNTKGNGGGGEGKKEGGRGGNAGASVRFILLCPGGSS